MSGICSTFAGGKDFCSMILNYIWIGLVLIAVVVGIVQFAVFGQSEVFTEILNSTFSSAKSGFEIS